MLAILQERFFEKDRFAPGQSIARSDPNVMQKTVLPLADQLAIALLLVFWLAAGLTNPLLFHPIAGVNYATLGALSAMATTKKRTPDRRPGLLRSHRPWKIAGNTHDHA